MMQFELDKVVAKALEYFPKTNGAELKLLRKVMGHLEQGQAEDILDDIKLTTKYLTLPLPALSAKCKAIRNKDIGEQWHCWMLHKDPDKFQYGKSKWHDVVVIAQSAEGAKAEVAKYMERFGLVPTDYDLFIGQETFNQFFWARAKRIDDARASQETPVTTPSAPQELTKPEIGTTGTPTTFESLKKLSDDDIPF